MPVLVDNKHYKISISGPITFELENKLVFNWTYTLKTTRATKFQAKKLLKRKIIALLLNLCGETKNV